MFLLKTIFITCLIPLVLSLFFYIKDKLILKREFVLFQSQNKNADKFILINLILAFFIVSLAMFALYFTLGIYKIWNSSNIIFIISHSITYIFIGLLFFLIIYYNKIHRFRSILFILIAVFFTIDFFSELYEARGHFMYYTYEDIIQGEIPTCHMVIPQSIIPAILKGTFIFPGKGIENNIGIDFTIGSMIIIWLSVSLVLGRGWCSWVCFWGGWEEGFSLIKKKPVLKNFNYKLKWIPFALLVVMAVTSLIFIAPVYCWWLCPFKGVSEYGQIVSPINLIQAIIFIVIFLVLVIVLPILSKKRTQCAFFCPFGAFQSLIDKINIFAVRIDKDKCIKCGKCIKECPVLSITEKSIEKGKSGLTCIKCGKCIDICPVNAISYHIKGIPKTGNISRIISFITKYLFLLIAFIFMGTMGGGMITDGFYRILLFITTGSFIE